MNSRELAAKLSELIRSERKITNEILQLISLGLARRSYLELGYSSMFDWLTVGFGYSSSAAYRRIEAARLLNEMPDLSEKLAEGKVNLTTVCKAQTLLKKQEQVSGQKITLENKRELIASIEDKSSKAAEQTLLAAMPEAASEVYQERHIVIDDQTIRHQLNISNEVAHNLKRVKDLLSHKFHTGTDAEVISFLIDDYLKRNDPLRNSTAAAAVKKPKTNKLKMISQSVRLKVVRSSEGKCTYKDPVTGRVCGSSYQTQLDHIVPRALGGSNHPSNLRVLCRQHNLLVAEKIFGKQLMDKYRKLGSGR